MTATKKSRVISACFLIATCSVLQGVAVHYCRRNVIDESLWWINDSTNHPLTSVSFIEGHKKNDEKANTVNDKTTYLKFIADTGYVVDKSLLLEEIVNHPKSVILATYPKRFGKSLNLQMIKLFLHFEIDANGEKRDPKDTIAYSLFKKGEIKVDKDMLHLKPPLKISEKEEAIEKHLGQYPVIHLSLQGLNSVTKSFDQFLVSFGCIISDILHNDEYEYINRILTTQLHNPNLNKYLRRYAERIKPIFEEFQETKANETSLLKSVFYISEFLHKTFKKNVVILLDEYDYLQNVMFISPPLASRRQRDEEYNQRVVNFLRDFFAQSFKNNQYLERAVITGCLKLAKDDISFSANFAENYDFHTERINPYYGFLEGEVYELVKKYQPEYVIPRFADVKDLYDGYVLPNDARIYPLYNPYVIGEFISSGQLEEYYYESGIVSRELPYFLTVKNFRQNFQRCIGVNGKNEAFTLTSKTDEITLQEGFAIRDFMAKRDSDKISLVAQPSSMDSISLKYFYHKGYFTALKRSVSDNTVLTLRLTNEEIRRIFLKSYLNFLSNQLLIDMGILKDFAEYFVCFISSYSQTARQFRTEFENLLSLTDPSTFDNLETFSPKLDAVIRGNKAVVHHILTSLALHVEGSSKDFDIYLPVSVNQPDVLFVWPDSVAIVEVEFDQNAESALNQAKKYTKYALHEVLYRDKSIAKPNAFTFHYIGINVMPLNNVSVLVEKDVNVCYNENVQKTTIRKKSRR